MEDVFTDDVVLDQLNKVTKLAYGKDYFDVLGLLIHQITHADYTFISRVNHTTQQAEPITSIKGGVLIENLDYDLADTPCFEVVNTCTGFYPSNVKELFPSDQFLKELDVDGYLGVSVVPEGEEKPVIILTCMYQKEAEEAQKYLNLMRFVANCIEERVEREVIIEENLRNKTLLKEIHHRVKNNLQIVSSLLNLQKRKVNSSEAEEVLNMSQNRVQTMALIHELLYRSSQMDKINIKEYVRLIANYILSDIDGNKIDYRLEVDNIELDIDKITPCGFILCEALSNSIKYAFSEEEVSKLSINISFHKVKNHYQFRIKDNGKGFIEEIIRGRELDSLGIELIKTLVDQIEGKVLFSNENGAVITIVF